jgi:ABC-2 type transport system ATP-binding protein
MQALTGLQLNGVRKAFTNLVAVDDLSFHVPAGSMFGLLGANGAGKTTTLRMILSILLPDRGTITLNGREVKDVPRWSFGYLPEERGLYPKMKTGEQLVFLGSLNNLNAAEATRRAREGLARMSLGEQWNRKVEELSKGNQQKVQVLAAILHDPELMLLDEPFSGLDPINTDVLRDTLFERRDLGRTIIFSSHRLEQVEEVCDYIAIIHRGRLLLTGSISDVKSNTGRNFVEVAFDVPGNGHAPDFSHFLSSLKPHKLSVVEQWGDRARIELLDGTPAEQVLHLALENGPGALKRFEVAEPTLQEIFIDAVGRVDPAAVEQVRQEGAIPGRKVLTEG